MKIFYGDLMEWRPADFFTLRESPASGTASACFLCSHRCVLGPGERGLCGVRRGGARGVETAAFVALARHRTPIERKPLYHCLPGATTLTLSAGGCCFSCLGCINHGVSQRGRSSAPLIVETSAEVLVAEAEVLIAEAAAAGLVLAFSYSEPLVSAEWATSLARAARKAGVMTVWKTNGFVTPEALGPIAATLDAVNIDLKAGDEAAHRALTGAPLRPVQDAIAGFRAAGVWVEVSTTLTPEAADHPAAWAKISSWLAEVDCSIPWHVAPFTPIGAHRSAAPTRPNALAAAVAVGRRAGLRYVYAGRGAEDEARETRCPDCRALAVARPSGADPRRFVTETGECLDCGFPLPGLWRARDHITINKFNGSRACGPGRRGS